MSVVEKLTKMPAAKKVFFLAFFVVLVGAGFWLNWVGIALITAFAWVVLIPALGA